MKVKRVRDGDCGVAVAVAKEKATVRRIVLGMCVGLCAVGSAQTPPKSFIETLPQTVVKIEMVLVPGGTVTIGGKKVEVKPVYMATTETVWEAFDAFTASGDPSKPYETTIFGPDAIARPSKSYILPDAGWGHKGYPVINVAYESTMMFCRWLASVTKKKYRLPTEAEWENACRAGVNGPWKIEESDLKEQGWYEMNSEAVTHPVGKKKANKFGLFDTLGNVGEWATDLEGKPVLCGGTFRDFADDVTPMKRSRYSPEWQESDPQMPKSRWWLADGPFCGFRLVCEP